MTEPTIKDSGEREGYAGGMVRDTEDGKIDWTNLFFGPMARRWAIHTTKGRAKYDDPEPGIPNWSLGLDLAVWLRARRSFLRHEKAWLAGETDEDHAAGMFFNVNLKEYIEERLSAKDRDAAHKIERLHARALGFSEGELTPAQIDERYGTVIKTPAEIREAMKLPETPWGECGKTCSGRRCFDTGCQGDNPNFQPYEAGDTGDGPSGRELLERARTPLPMSVAAAIAVTELAANKAAPSEANLTPWGDSLPSRGAAMRQQLKDRETLGDPNE